MTRFILYAALGFLAGAGILYVMAVQAGLEPFAPNIRTLSFLALLVAAYFGVRVALLIRSLERRKGREANGKTRKSGSAFRNWGRDRELDARLQARRDRLRRAKEKQESGDQD